MISNKTYIDSGSGDAMSGNVTLFGYEQYLHSVTQSLARSFSAVQKCDWGMDQPVIFDSRSDFKYELCELTESCKDISGSIQDSRFKRLMEQLNRGEESERNSRRGEILGNDDVEIIGNDDVPHNLTSVHHDFCSDNNFSDVGVASFSGTLQDTRHLGHPCAHDTSMDQFSHSPNSSDNLLQNNLRYTNLSRETSHDAANTSSYLPPTEGNTVHPWSPPSGSGFVDGQRLAEGRQGYHPSQGNARGHKRSLSCGASPESKRPRLELGGRTPLHLAIEMGFQDIVEMLVDAGADVNALDEFGRSPLHLAGEYGHAEIARLLQCAGAVGTDGAPFVPQMSGGKSTM